MISSTLLVEIPTLILVDVIQIKLLNLSQLELLLSVSPTIKQFIDVLPLLLLQFVLLVILTTKLLLIFVS